MERHTSFASEHRALQHYVGGFGLYDVQLRAIDEGTSGLPAARPVLGSGVLLFPACYPAHDGAGDGDIYRAAAAHALAHLRYSPCRRPAGKFKAMQVAVRSLIEDARAERLLLRDYPGLWTLWRRFHVASGSSADLSFRSLAARLARALHDPGYGDPNYWVNKGRELFEARAGHLDNVVMFDEIGDILASDLGQMRVRFDLQQYCVEPGYRDDNSLLWDFAQETQDTPRDESLTCEAVQLELAPTLAGAAATATPAALAAPEQERRYHYAEWDYRTALERPRWVTVIDMPASGTQSGPADIQPQLTIRTALPDAAAHMLCRSVPLRRQHEGDELDLNAAIESRISQRGRIAPDPRIFRHRGRRRRSLAILLLLDLSESTNDCIGETFTTVLDVEKRASVVVAESIDPGHVRLALHGFASNGRDAVRYVRIKDFDEPFDVSQRQLLMQQRGAWSTRIGAALRHAGSCLATEHVDKKIVLLVTDGEPSDIDVFDRRYLIEDARHAAVALKARDVDTFCMTLDRRADTYVREIFGAWSHLIVDDPTSLPLHVSRVLAKIAAR